MGTQLPTMLLPQGFGESPGVVSSPQPHWEVGEGCRSLLPIRRDGGVWGDGFALQPVGIRGGGAGRAPLLGSRSASQRSHSCPVDTPRRVAPEVVVGCHHPPRMVQGPLPRGAGGLCPPWRITRPVPRRWRTSRSSTGRTAPGPSRTVSPSWPTPPRYPDRASPGPSSSPSCPAAPRGRG